MIDDQGADCGYKAANFLQVAWDFVQFLPSSDPSPWGKFAVWPEEVLCSM